MRTRIVNDGAGGWRAADNAGWKPRDPLTVESIYAGGGSAT